jgi:hypothetical protein
MPSEFTPQGPETLPLSIIRNDRPERIGLGGWLTAHNVAARNGALVKCTGWSDRGETVDGVPNLILPARFNDTIQTIIGTNRWLYRYADDGTLQKINASEFAAAETERWQADYELGQWYFTNFTDGLQRYDGGENFEAVATGGSDANGIRGAFLTQFLHHLILANLAGADSFGAHQFLGSGLKVADWATDDANSDATLDDIPDDATAFRGVRRLPGGLALYKETAIYFASYIGLPNVYQIDQRVAGKGLLAPYSLVDNGQAHIFVGQDDILGFSGGQPQEIGARIWSWWQDQIEPGQRHQVYAFHDPRKDSKEIHFVYHALGASAYTRALTWNYLHNSFTTRDLPFSAIGFAAKSTVPTFAQLAGTPMSEIGPLLPAVNTQDFELVGAKADGTLYTFSDNTHNADGDLLTMELQTGTVGGGMQARACGGVLLQVAELTGSPLQVFVSGRKSLGDPLNWKGPFLFRGDRDRVNCIVTGRYHDFKFIKPGGRCELRGFAPLFRELG